MRFKFLMAAFLALPAACSSGSSGGPADYVDPLIGSGFHGHVFVGANVPFSLVQAGPTSVSQGWDWCSGYHESDSTVIGFSHTHLSGTGCGDLLDITLMPVTGKDLVYARGSKDDPRSGLWSMSDRSREVAGPGYYSVPLVRYGILAEMSATQRCAIHRYTFPASDEAAVVIDLKNGGNWDHTTEAYAETVGNRTVRGWRYSKGWAKNQKVYFYAEFSRPFDTCEFVAARTDYRKLQERMYSRLCFRTKEGERLLVKVGLSPTGVEAAEKNLRTEISGWNFDRVRRDARRAWNRELSKIRIDAGEETKTIFYTALYHAMVAPSLFSDSGSPDDYTTFSLWDTYRAQMPLLSIIEPERMNAMVEAMLGIYRRQGFLPIWHLFDNETYCMPGEAGVIAVADAIVKGFSGFGREAAFEALKASLDTVGQGNELRMKYGYVPSDLTDHSVAKDMEFAIADAAVASAARCLGREEDAAFYENRSHSYRNYMDPETGFARGRLSDGSMRTPFNPFESSHNENDYCEGNAWQYSFLAPHDVPWLMEFSGGAEAFCSRLDSLFCAPLRLDGEACPDITGMIGQYVHGNEPSHHIAYLYAMAGQPGKTAERVREILTTLYSTGRSGLCGNEDVGQMSAWYVLSALGFYQVEPASTRFWFGSPIVDRAEIEVGGGRVFTVVARNNSARNKYIRSIKLNGKPYDLPFIDFRDIRAGGELIFEMGAEQAD